MKLKSMKLIDLSVPITTNNSNASIVNKISPNEENTDAIDKNDVNTVTTPNHILTILEISSFSSTSKVQETLLQEVGLEKAIESRISKY